MNLIDFYKTDHVVQNDAGAMFYIKLNPNHVIYNGHFPGQPVLPGVCTVQIIKECTQQLTDKNLQYKRIVLCKFLRFVDPVQCNEIVLTITINEKDDGTFYIVASGDSGGSVFIKIKAIMGQ